jgi:hypothetical protein
MDYNKERYNEGVEQDVKEILGLMSLNRIGISRGLIEYDDAKTMASWNRIKLVIEVEKGIAPYASIWEGDRYLRMEQNMFGRVNAFEFLYLSWLLINGMKKSGEIWSYDEKKRLKRDGDETLISSARKYARSIILSDKVIDRAECKCTYGGYISTKDMAEHLNMPEAEVIEFGRESNRSWGIETEGNQVKKLGEFRIYAEKDIYGVRIKVKYGEAEEEIADFTVGEGNKLVYRNDIRHNNGIVLEVVDQSGRKGLLEQYILMVSEGGKGVWKTVNKLDNLYDQGSRDIRLCLPRNSDGSHMIVEMFRSSDKEEKNSISTYRALNGYVRFEDEYLGITREEGERIALTFTHDGNLYYIKYKSIGNILGYKDESSSEQRTVKEVYVVYLIAQINQYGAWELLDEPIVAVDSKEIVEAIRSVRDEHKAMYNDIEIGDLVRDENKYMHDNVDMDEVMVPVEDTDDWRDLVRDGKSSGKMDI